MSENQRKRFYLSKDRVTEAKKILDEKNKNYKPADSSKEYVCCYDCVINDDTSISAHASIVMQRFKLTNHYTKYHPDCVKQEYKFTEEKPAKQSKLSIFINLDDSVGKFQIVGFVWKLSAC